MNRVLQRIAAVTPDWLRHAAVLFGSAFAGVLLKAIITAQGVTDLNWTGTLTGAVDTAATTTAAGMLLLIITPATRHYGVGSGQQQDTRQPSGDAGPR